MFPDVHAVKYMKTNGLYSPVREAFDWQETKERDNSAALANVVEEYELDWIQMLLHISFITNPNEGHVQKTLLDHTAFLITRMAF